MTLPLRSASGKRFIMSGENRERLSGISAVLRRAITYNDSHTPISNNDEGERLGPDR